jgi:3-hydroxyacyl-CoA dehydrogenase / enoyl-CoA hydratase / 3-hydroxybutyryl-CoA epimerase
LRAVNFFSSPELPLPTGGPLSYIDSQGLSAFVARCDELAERYFSERLRPPEILRRIAADGGTIYGTNW